jgi:hypothetical protein
MRGRWWRTGLVMLTIVVTAVAVTMVGVAVNVATGGTSPWLPSVEDHPLVWAVGTTAFAAVAGWGEWTAQRMWDRRLADLVPDPQRPEAWVVGRSAEVRQVVAALRDRAPGSVGITTAVRGEGGFGKTTVAKMVGTDPTILRRFRGRIFG